MSSQINNVVKSIINADLVEFKNLIHTTPALLQENFPDPDKKDKQINILNLILSYGDKEFFAETVPYITADLINNSQPVSPLFTAVKLANKDSEFLDILLSFNPSLLVKDDRNNNLLSTLAIQPLASANYAVKFMEAGVQPFETIPGRRDNPFYTAAYNNRPDIVKEIISYTKDTSPINNEHLISLLKNNMGDEFKSLVLKNPAILENADLDYLFNQGCLNNNVVAIDTILEETSFFPGAEQLSALIDLMCDKYDLDAQKQSSGNIAEYLFSLKIPFDKFNNPEGKNAWELAIRNKNNEVFQLLVDSPTRISFQDEDKLTPLMYAIQEENLDFVKKIVEKKPYLIHRDNYGNTPLIMAVRRKLIDIVDFLAKQPNIGVNEVNDQKETALNLAIKLKNIDMVNSLIWSGANITLHPHTVLENNSVYGFNEQNVFVALHDHQDTNTINNFNALIAYGFDPNQKNDSGDTLINHFIKNGYLQNFQALVRCKVDLEVPDSNGNTPLMNAFSKNTDDYAISITHFSHHLDLQHKNKQGEDVYDIAAECHSARRVAALVLADSELRKADLNKVIPILAMDASFYSLTRITDKIDTKFIDSNENDLLMLSVLGSNNDNFRFFQAECGLKPNLKQRNSLGKNLFDLINDIENPEDKNSFIHQLSSDHQEKFDKYIKKKLNENLKIQ